MKKVILQFRNILDLTDFVSVIAKQDLIVDSIHLTITGCFEEADIELARAGYWATVVEASE